MKKHKTLFFFFGLMFGAFFSAQCQTFGEGDVVFTPGFGVLNRLTPDDYDFFVPPIVLAGELGIGDNMGVGAGLLFGSSRYEERYYKSRATFFAVEGRFYYHFNEVFEVENLDWYGYAGLGVYRESYREDIDFDNGPDYLSERDTYFGPYITLMGGARYYVSPKFAIMGELGFGVAPFIAGVSIKL